MIVIVSVLVALEMEAGKPAEEASVVGPLAD